MPKIAKTDKGRHLNRQETADFFGYSLTTVDNWVRAGCPVVQRGSQGVTWIFNSRDVHTWLVDKAVEQATGKKGASGASNADEMKGRLVAAQAEMAELELAKAKQEVVALPQVERALSNAFAAIQAGMRNLPARVARLVIGETDEVRFKAVLLKEIDQALSSLADINLAGTGDEDEASMDPSELDITDLDDEDE